MFLLLLMVMMLLQMLYNMCGVVAIASHRFVATVVAVVFADVDALNDPVIVDVASFDVFPFVIILISCRSFPICF